MDEELIIEPIEQAKPKKEFKKINELYFYDEVTEDSVNSFLIILLNFKIRS